MYMLYEYIQEKILYKSNAFLKKLNLLFQKKWRQIACLAIYE
jgi:hypothetical protein